MSRQPTAAEIATNWDTWASRRVDFALAKGERWLTTDDHWQKGDSYKASPEWWAVNTAWWGLPVDIGCICYTPMGSTRREKTS